MQLVFLCESISLVLSSFGLLLKPPKPQLATSPCALNAEQRGSAYHYPSSASEPRGPRPPPFPSQKGVTLEHQDSSAGRDAMVVQNPTNRPPEQAEICPCPSEWLQKLPTTTHPTTTRLLSSETFSEITCSLFFFQPAEDLGPEE